MVFVRGDHRVNDDQARQRARRALPPGARGGAAGPRRASSGPTPDVADALDDAVAPAGLRGAAPTGPTTTSWRHVDGRARATCARVEAGDTVNGNPIRIEPAIEIGNIFKLGTRYSEPLGATYLDESGKEQLIVMGSYGIGPARITAAAIEQYADEQGISWPRAIAPWDVEIVALGKPGTPEREAAEALYAELCADGPRGALRRPRRRRRARSSPTPSCSACRCA